MQAVSTNGRRTRDRHRRIFKIYLSTRCTLAAFPHDVLIVILPLMILMFSDLGYQRSLVPTTTVSAAPLSLAAFTQEDQG